jgi:hypothetical protein
LITFRMAMPGSETANPASVPSSVSCALNPANPSATSGDPLAGSGAPSASGHVVRLVGVRPAGVVDALGVRSELVGGCHLGHERAAGHQVELREHEHTEREWEEPQGVEAERHQNAQHDAPRGGQEDHDPARPTTRVDRRPEHG